MPRSAARSIARPTAPVHLEFFYNETADPSGSGQGTIYLGSLDLQTDANGDQSFTTALKLPASTGFIVATATVNGNTSEFSKDFTIGDQATLQVVASGSGLDTFVNTLFPTPLVVQATLDGQPLAGAVIVFAAPQRRQSRRFLPDRQRRADDLSSGQRRGRHRRQRQRVVHVPRQ